MISRRGMGLIAVVALGAGLLGGGVATGQDSGRIIRGQVLDEKGETVAQAIVHLRNKSSNDTVTMVASDEGRFQFNDVDMKDDYKIHAELKGKKSRQRSISQFDTRPIVVVNLRLKATEEKAEKSKNEKEKED